VTAYLADVWKYRNFWLSLVRMDLQARYRRSALGIGWSLLHPLISSLVLCFAFYRFFHVSVRDYVPYLMAGLAWWGFVTGAIGRGCQCFVEAEGYIRQHPMPMAIYPLRTTLGTMIHFLIALVVVLGLTWSLKSFDNLAALPSLTVGLAILLVFGWSAAVVAGYVNTIFRDIQHLTDLCFSLLFYLTPVMYPPEAVNGSGMGWLLRYNPLTYLLKIVRDPLVNGQVPSWRAYGVAVASTVIAALAAAMLLGRIQRKVIYYL
jgi:lipopolysaccharide transport system permease protein